jgi:1-acyl-sn-glycerol-3-phosphate acyltransferase
VLIVVGLFTYSDVKFNNNLANLNFVPDDMKRSEAQLEGMGSIGAKSIYVVAYGASVDDVVSKNHHLEKKLKELKNNGLIEDYTSMGGLVLPIHEQELSFGLWTDFWQENKVSALASQMNSAANDIGFKKDFYQDFEKELTRSFKPLSADDYLQIEALPIGDFLSERDGFYTFSSILKIDEANRNELLKLLQKEDLVIVDRKHLNEQFLGQLKDDFLYLMNLSFAVIFIIMLLFFRRIELAILAMVPIVCTGLITAGIMSLLNIELNIFSTIVTTLILGLGIDFSIFMTSGLQIKYTTGKNELSVYRTSILLAAFTTVLALGTLVFAKHPALTSISWASLIGVLSALFMTFVFYPVLFAIFIEKRPKKGKSSASLRLFLTSVASYLYYGVGGVFYSIFGVIFMRFVPIKRDNKERWYRRVIAKFIKSVMYTNPCLTNKILNPSNEKFDKPAIIIANHSSFLDTLSMGFIKTPIIFLVNDWVYNSPIFGKAVQLAGYYPVSSGIENGEQKLIDFIQKGYSLVIFPEGTRSPNKHIGRFHKGAFHLAKTYNIDIVPVYIHGNGDLVPKGDFIIYDGQHTTVIGDRIPFQSFENQDVKFITKQISAIFKSRFSELRSSLENEDYFKKKIALNFLYKTPDIVRAAAQEFDLYKKGIHLLNAWIPKDALIQRIADDFGVIDLLLCLQEPLRNVQTLIVDSEKEAVAKQSYLLKTYKIKYSNTIKESSNVLLLNAKFANQDLDHFVCQGVFELIIIETDKALKPKTGNYEQIDLDFGFTILKKVTNA